ncbi:alpha/beta fold hydrolase [Laspinema olomoucense]|uniref:Alpha/beta hydrolase n=1 Tax=Laspinema olomoucense D3b TaxID=2953688 RepID=A0ABT2N836_9CYAN|nr:MULTISPECIES: alpha/beta hydrolase [unclassified Laspinema]MCT7975765.1 alpha/beta hydrolase [Laspinema sp. D3d]MCT7978863.1 alpha/beta hydrolase [Laspinema sp. D3b]MCT7988415.1 alpha/beta hydrolase [Laspinema sp. D3a]MCT7996458.1 alpha/beta hydrolase [Laspinema sp. D3c]
MTSAVETWTHNTIAVNGITLHYVTQGEGPLMLMLHGFPEFWYSWRHQIPEFAQDYKVVAVDMRGYNDSDKPQDLSAYQIQELIQDIEGIITGLGYESCVLVGHDWGGAIAWYFAYSYPQLVQKLIVLNIPHPAKFGEGLRSNPQQVFKSSYAFFFQLPLVPELLIQFNDYQAIETAFQSMAVNKNAFSPADITAYKNAAAKPGALTAMLNYYRKTLWELVSDKEWNLLEVPTLMIWGEDDTALGKELTYGTESYVRNLQIRYIPNCSHWVQQEQPERVNQYMRAFLSESLEK